MSHEKPHPATVVSPRASRRHAAAGLRRRTRAEIVLRPGPSGSSKRDAEGGGATDRQPMQRVAPGGVMGFAAKPLVVGRRGLPRRGAASFRVAPARGRNAAGSEAAVPGDVPGRGPGGATGRGTPPPVFAAACRASPRRLLGDGRLSGALALRTDRDRDLSSVRDYDCQPAIGWRRSTETTGLAWLRKH